jgi:hydrogenase expression/formation protein HypC
MCLAVPGKILRMQQQDGVLMADLDFGGVIKSVCLEYVPDAHVGQYVMVHAGFAINLINEEEVAEFHRLWQQVLDQIPGAQT